MTCCFMMTSFNLVVSVGMHHQSTNGIQRARKQWAFLLVFLILFGGLIALSLWYERQRMVAEQFSRLSTKARVIDENVVRQIEGVNLTLKYMLGDSPVAAHKVGDTRPGVSELKALAQATLGVRTFSLLNGKGVVLASSRDEIVGLNVADRAYFQVVVREPDPQALYLTQPFRTALGVYSMNLVRVRVDAHGQVSQVAAATLDPEFFSVLLSSVRFDDDVWVALAHVGGDLVMRYPQRPDLLGSNLNRPGSLFSRHLASGQSSTVLVGEAKAAGVPGWMAQRTILAPQLNMKGALVVAVARNPAAALAPFTKLAMVGAALWMAVALVCSSALVILQRHKDLENARLAEVEALKYKAEEEVRQLAFHDPLTGLPNRRLFQDRLQQLLAASIRQQRLSALLFLDLDGFKQLNDSLGHDAGDQLLIEVARRLQSLIRQEETASRWGGDEFAVVLSSVSADVADAGNRVLHVANKILETLSRPYDLMGRPYQCTASIGATLLGLKDEPIGDIFKRADEAMYEAKAAGKNTFRLWSRQL